MIKVGITGQSGFVGTHLFNHLGFLSDKFERIYFNDNYFNDDMLLRKFVSSCDVILHLAAMSRDVNQGVVYKTNIDLVKKLIKAIELENCRPYILFSSSIQEEIDNEYGNSKRIGRDLFKEWAKTNNASFTSMIFPNVYGPFSKPNYVSFIATFCYKLINNENTEIIKDNNVKLIYINNLIDIIIKQIGFLVNEEKYSIESYLIPYDFEMKVSEVLMILNQYKVSFVINKKIPLFRDLNDLNLFNTFISYINSNN